MAVLRVEEKWWLSGSWSDFPRKETLRMQKYGSDRGVRMSIVGEKLDVLMLMRDIELNVRVKSQANSTSHMYVLLMFRNYFSNLKWFIPGLWRRQLKQKYLLTTTSSFSSLPMKGTEGKSR